MNGMDFRSVGDTAGGSRTCCIAAYYVANDFTALSRETLDIQIANYSQRFVVEPDLSEDGQKNSYKSF